MSLALALQEHFSVLASKHARTLIHTHIHIHTHTHTHTHTHNEQLNVTGRFYPIEVLFSQQSPATHHSRTEVPAPLWVDRLSDAHSVVSSAKLRRRQLLVAARDTQPVKGAGQDAGAVRGAESRWIIIIKPPGAGAAAHKHRARAERPASDTSHH